MIPVYLLECPEYKTGEIDNSRTDTVFHYGLEGIPVTYIENQPGFDYTAMRLRDFLRSLFSHEKLCIRGVSISEHNRANGSSLSVDALIQIITDIGHDRYNPEIAGNKYDNLENLHIDIFAYDVLPDCDDNDLTYFFQSFYWYGLAENGEPGMVDIIIVYDADFLNRIHHHYPGRCDIKRDGFTFRVPNKTVSVRCIIKLKQN